RPQARHGPRLLAGLRARGRPDPVSRGVVGALELVAAHRAGRRPALSRSARADPRAQRRRRRRPAGVASAAPPAAVPGRPAGPDRNRRRALGPRSGPAVLGWHHVRGASGGDRRADRPPGVSAVVELRDRLRRYYTAYYRDTLGIPGWPTLVDLRQEEEAQE